MYLLTFDRFALDELERVASWRTMARIRAGQQLVKQSQGSESTIRLFNVTVHDVGITKSEGSHAPGHGVVAAHLAYLLAMQDDHISVVTEQR